MNSKNSATLAIPFISFHQNQGFKLSPEAQQFLTSLPEDRQLGIVSIVGKYRTGKSFFVNRVLLDQKKSGFQVGPTINPCTKGLWLWKKTIPSENNPNMDLILVDTEGFGGMDENANHDSRIFLFSLLLSSYFIYNSVGSIDQNAINTLNLIINLAKDIQTKSNSNDDESQFPSFLWIVRDFTLKLVDKNQTPITSKEYLENALEFQKGSNDATQKKNKIRRLLKQFFQDRDCETMVRPTEAQKDLQKLDQIDNSLLRPQFVNQVKAIRHKVYSHVKPKKINGQCLNGNLLVSLCKGYMEHINKGSLPNVQSAWFYVCRSEGLKALNQSAKVLESLLDELAQNPPNLQDISAEKQRITQIVMKQFKKRAMNAEQGHPDLLEKLTKRIDDEFSSFVRREEKRKIQEEMERLENENYNLKAEEGRMKMQLEELDDLKLQNARLKLRLEETTNQKTELLKKTEQLEEINSNLKGQQKQKMRQESEQIDELKRQNVKLKKKLEEAMKEKSDAMRKTLELEQLNFNLKEEEEKIKSQLEENDELKQENARLRKRLEEVIKEKSETQKQAQKLEGLVNAEDWLLEKSYLENQVAFLKNSMAENKKLHDALLIAFQRSVLSNDEQTNEELLQANKNMSLTLQKMQEKYRVLEEKYSSLKDIKKVVKNCSSMECSFCRKLVPTELFLKHLSQCTEEQTENMPDRARQISDNITVSLNFRDSEDKKKPIAEYVIQVTKSGSKSKAVKRSKDFSELHKSLIFKFPAIKYPESSKFLCDFSYMMTMKKSMVAEQKRKAIQQYLRDLSKIPQVRDSEIFRDFLEPKQSSKMLKNSNLQQ